MLLSSLLSYCDYKASNYSYGCMRTRLKCLRESLVEKVLLSFSLSWLPRFQVNAFFAEGFAVLRCLLFTQLQLRVLQVYRSISVSLKRSNEIIWIEQKKSHKKMCEFLHWKMVFIKQFLLKSDIVSCLLISFFSVFNAVLLLIYEK